MRIAHSGPVRGVNEAPSHPEVNQENQTAFEPDNQILAPARNGSNALARELGSHLCGIDGPRQPGFGDLPLVEPATDEPRLERRANGLDLGQLGHQLSLARQSAQAIITPRMTLRGAGASSSSLYAASTSSAADAALSSSRAWISASGSPAAT